MFSLKIESCSVNPSTASIILPLKIPNQRVKTKPKTQVNCSDG